MINKRRVAHCETVRCQATEKLRNLHPIGYPSSYFQYFRNCFARKLDDFALQKYKLFGNLSEFEKK
uniref:Uncharacterized protein n=1 Tax=Elizabethkingia anophelis TaxID=1117645 RepID=A0A455ZF92_9FLAO|nr:TPA_exp: hypothetical protein [Elizabethkingia anophelis]